MWDILLKRKPKLGSTKPSTGPRVGHSCSSDCKTELLAVAHEIIQGGDWGDRPPKTYECNFIHHNFAQCGKEQSPYKAFLSSTVLLQQCCEVYFIPLTVAKPL